MQWRRKDVRGFGIRYSIRMFNMFRWSRRPAYRFEDAEAAEKKSPAEKDNSHIHDIRFGPTPETQPDTEFDVAARAVQQYVFHDPNAHPKWAALPDAAPILRVLGPVALDLSEKGSARRISARNLLFQFFETALQRKNVRLPNASAVQAWIDLQLKIDTLENEGINDLELDRLRKTQRSVLDALVRSVNP